MRLITWTTSMLALLAFAALATAGAPHVGEIAGRVIDAQTRQPVAGATVVVEGTALSATTGADGTYLIRNVPVGDQIVRVEPIGTLVSARHRAGVSAGRTATVDFAMVHLARPMDRPEEERDEKARKSADLSSKVEILSGPGRTPRSMSTKHMIIVERPDALWQSPGFESYDTIDENAFHSAIDKPLSTFSVDVDAASYGNVRRFVTAGRLPPRDAVRIEELINYFDYDYPDPRGKHPFSITTEVADCPWNTNSKLVQIGLQGKRLAMEELPPSNIVFLLDVSGSMNQPNKLPLLKSSFRLLVDNLRPQDRVAIVVYAGAAGLVLPSTSGSNRDEILCAIDRLRAGGATAGGQGIQLAYRVAQENFIEDGNNRIILATDGDFNVGMSSDGDMVRLIEQKRRSGVFLTVLGFGQGNLKDSKMEKIANKGNGHYAYIDDIIEAKKVLINELGATLLTIAKDVKIQVEFNPALVESYRLIGYENRLLRNRDFDDDTKDAGEIGAGHSVTALYELVMTDRASRSGRKLKYSDRRVRGNSRYSDELLTVQFRYKPPSASESRLLSRVVKNDDVSFEEASNDFRLSAAVAQFGMILRESPYAGELSMAEVIAAARAARGEDVHGYRAEFVRLAETADLLLSPAVGVR